MSQCAICTRKAGDGNACHTCVAAILADLHQIPWLHTQLVITYTRQDRLASTGGRRTKDAGQPLAYHLGARHALDTMHATLARWSRGADVPNTPAAMARWIAARTDFRHDRHVDLMAAAFEQVGKLALQAINPPDGDMTFGVCGAELPDQTTCTAYLYGERAAAWVRCRRCRTQHDTHARLTWMHLRARVLYFRAATLARILPLMTERPVSANNIRSWAFQGRPIRTQLDDHGVLTYCCGDVIAVAEATPTRNRKGSAA